MTNGTQTVTGGVEGVTPATLSATFSDANHGAPTSDFSGTINWGDGQITPFTSSDVTGSNGSYTISGTHLYAEEGTNTIIVTVNDDGGSSATISGSTTVADAVLTAGAVTAPTATEGAAFTDRVLFHFTDADPNGAAGDYTATITWGDGHISIVTSTHTSDGQVVANAGDGFDVLGSHTYLEEATGLAFSVSVTDHTATTSAGATINVADALLANVTGVNLGAITSKAFTGVVVATFTDPGGAEPITGNNYVASINWGDGTAATAGTITYNSVSKVFTVNGGHTYASDSPAGGYTVTATITHEALAPVTAISTATVVKTVWVDDNWADVTNPGGPLTLGDTVVAPTGETAPGNPPTLIYGVDAFNTVQGGINADAANGTVYVLPGTYSEYVTINQSINLVGAGGLNSIVNGTTSSSTGAIITVSAPNVTINGFDIVDRNAGAGIAAVGNYAAINGLHILNNTISDSSSNKFSNTLGSSYSAGIVFLNNPYTNASTVTIQGNQVIKGSTTFQRGIWIYQAGAVIGGATAALGNSVTGSAQDVLVASANAATTMQNNSFNLAGVTITEPNGNAPATITNNAFSTPTSSTKPDDALLLIKHDFTASSPVSIQGNTFTVPNSSIGILSAASIGVSVSGNTFAPASGATNTVDIDVDTLYPTSTQYSPYNSNTISITGNVFNAPSGSNAISR